MITRFLMGSMKLTLALFLLGESVAARDATYSCSNGDFEISCDASECSMAEGFTPMSVQVSPDSLEVCAYSGCWSGEAVYLVDGDLLYAHGRELRWRDDPENVARFQIAIDRISNVAIMSGAGGTVR